MIKNPYSMLESHPKFDLVSDDMQDGQMLSKPQLSVRLGGGDSSPHLKWSGFPEETKSFAVTTYDPDAPTPSGFWHWAVYNISPLTTEIQSGVGSDVNKLPIGSVPLKNDRGMTTFIGAAPPIGTGKHRYCFVIYALDIEKLDLPADATPAFLTFNLLQHTLAWASLTPWYEQK